MGHDPLDGFRGHKRCPFCPFYQNKEGDGCHGKAAPEGAETLEPFLIVKRKNQTGDELNHGTAEKCHNNRQKNAKDNHHGLARVYILP